jgi:hypothetical protein
MMDVRLERGSDKRAALADAVPRRGGARTLHLMVTCSNRKSEAVPGRLRARSIRARRPEDRIQEWIQRVESVPASPVAATDLYAGEHWRLASGLPEAARTRGPVELWVLSAGYGLIKSRTPIKPYSAAFSGSQPDAVVRVRRGVSHRSLLQQWWAGLAGWRTAGMSTRSIAHAAKNDPDAAFLIVASPPYLQACAADIRTAFDKVQDQSRFLVLSVGGSTEGIGVPNVLPTDARLQRVVGGTLSALNDRLAHLVLRSFPVSDLRFEEVKRFFASMTAELPAHPAYGRAVSTDDEVKSFIRGLIGPKTSASRLLRQFRDGGRACEQSRFRRVYLEVEEEIGVN